MTKKICIITSNEDRYNFINTALSSFGINTERKSFSLIEIQADSAEQIAIAKALNAAKQLNEPVICEDTEFIINALNGFPGPYMKFAQSRISVEQLLAILQNEKDKNALFRSVLVYAEPNGLFKTFTTELEGKIIQEKRGVNGRGWDPVFELKKSRKTLAEYESLEKFELWNKGYLELGKWLTTKKD